MQFTAESYLTMLSPVISRVPRSIAPFGIACALLFMTGCAKDDPASKSQPEPKPTPTASGSEKGDSKPTPPAPTAARPAPTTPTKPAKPASEASEYKKLMDEARTAMMANKYGEAAKACKAALAVKPGDQGAITMCGIAACRMKDGALAKKYAEQAADARKAMIRQQCLKTAAPGFE